MHCSIDHFKIFEIAREYQNGALTRDQALNRLSRTDTTGYETFNTATGEVLRKLFTVAPADPAVFMPLTDNQDVEKELEIVPVPIAKAEANVTRVKRSKKIQ